MKNKKFVSFSVNVASIILFFLAFNAIAQDDSFSIISLN